jgi:xylan 1,4-beta-xylosidase
MRRSKYIYRHTNFTQPMKNRILRTCIILLVTITSYHSGFAQKTGQRAASITVDLKNETGDMYPFWAWFGHDEPNYTYMKDGRKLLTELAALSPVPVYMRVHNLLTTGDGTPALKWGSTNAYTEDEKGNPVYNWQIIDSIFSTYIKRGMKPYAQIGFMPEALSTHPQPYQHHWQPGTSNKLSTGWAYPPKDYRKWEELVYQWVKHSVEKFGKKEVESWYWEVWNEPNIEYWQGTREEFFKLYDYAASGAKRALPTIKIGGPEVAGTSSQGAVSFLRAFVEHCISGVNYATGKTGTAIDLVSFHAKGQPKVVDGHVRMNMAPQLRDIAMGFKIVKSYPETRDLPVIIGESDPEGCAACGMATNPANAYRNGTMYASYTAASFARKYLLADSLKVNFLGAVSWSFEFENQPWFYGYRDLATNGVDKPVLNVFRMLGMMKGKRLKVDGNRMYPTKAVVDSSVRKTESDIGALASTDKQSVAIMIWNYHDDDIKEKAEQVELTLKNLPMGTATLTHYRIDDEHSNAYEAWKKMGSPQNPDSAQIAALEKDGQLQMLGKPQKINIKAGQYKMELLLPRQGVSLIKIVR